MEWCDCCGIFVDSHPGQLARHQQGAKHKANADAKLTEMRKRGRDRCKQEDKMRAELARIERDAIAAHQADAPKAPVPHHASAERAARLADVERAVLDAKRPRQAPTAELPEGWRARVDPSGRFYYVHTPTGASQWERPQEVAADWQRGLAADGTPYYYSVSRCVTQWDVPVGWVEPAEAKGGMGAGDEYGAGVKRGSVETGGAHVPVAATARVAEGGAEAACSLATADSAKADTIDEATGLGAWSVVEEHRQTAARVAAVGGSGASDEGADKGANKGAEKSASVVWQRRDESDEGRREEEELVLSARAHFPVPETIRAAASEAEETSEVAFRKRPGKRGGSFRRRPTGGLSFEA